jgi:hypothetical protein
MPSCTSPTAVITSHNDPTQLFVTYLKCNYIHYDTYLSHDGLHGVDLLRISEVYLAEVALLSRNLKM